MASIVQPSAAFSVENGTHLAQQDRYGWAEGVLPGFLSELNGWQIAITILLILIAYDQCMLP
jgi:hypothetical protein